MQVTLVPQARQELKGTLGNLVPRVSLAPLAQQDHLDHLERTVSLAPLASQEYR